MWDGLFLRWVKNWIHLKGTSSSLLRWIKLRDALATQGIPIKHNDTSIEAKFTIQTNDQTKHCQFTRGGNLFLLPNGI